MDAPSKIFEVKTTDSVFDIPDTYGMLSTFPADKNISKENLIHLLKGEPLVDLSDEEYVHWLQLDEDALDYVRQHIC